MIEGTVEKSDKKIINPRLSLNSDLIYFKNDILTDLKKLEVKISQKIDNKNDETDSKLLSIQNTLDSLTQKIFNISNSFSESNYEKEKIESLCQFSSKMEELTNKYEIKLNKISKDLVGAINKYDNLILNNIFYQGIIGSNNAKFINFHQFIDYVLKNIKELVNFKEKVSGIDFNLYKKKLDMMMDGLTKQINDIMESTKIFTIHCVSNLEEKIKSNLNLYEEKLFNLKINNSERYNNLEKMTQNLIKEWETMNEVKKQIELIFGKNYGSYKNHFLAEKKLDQCLKDNIEMKKKIDLIIEYLKGVKSETATNMSFNEYLNKKSKVESYLKKYISGEVGMEQISQLSRKFSRRNMSSTENLFNNSNNLEHNKTFFRKYTSNNILSHTNSNISNYSNKNNRNNDNYKLLKSVSQINHMENIKSKFLDNANEKNINNSLKKDSHLLKRYNTSNFNNFNSFKKNEDNLKEELKDIKEENSIDNKNEKNNDEERKDSKDINNLNYNKKGSELKTIIEKENISDDENNNQKKIGYYSNKDLVKNHINNINYFGENPININENKANNNNRYNKGNKNINNNITDNTSLSNNYDFNIIVENNEIEEKDDEIENEKKNKNFNWQGKENNTTLQNLENMENNTAFNNTELFNNFSEHYFPTNKTFYIPESKKNKIFELKNKIITNNYNRQYFMNNNSKFNVHNLLTGNRNTLRYFKIINKGEEFSVSNDYLQDKKRNKYNKQYKLNNLNNRNRCSSSLHFYRISKPKLENFEKIANKSSIEDDYNISYENIYNNKIKNKSKSFSNKNRNNNKQKLHIVNFPEIQNNNIM